ncbi:hypothetical protein [Alloactinosynnema sp. L-07]|uniref:hypothetical protein n=1 Tax=Alloactinosynnema sp. L-07 TaxID=1653480 RepID=UPI00065EFA13|nr:hypothetical protein [Alloactinosynnema sp. L-07]CRK58911.1 hypothetical protein [Alloactinosynnema sp. L-07]
MVAEGQIRSMRAALRTIWVDGRPIERFAYVVGLGLLLSGIAHFGVFLIEGGPWQGPVSWRKPVTFGLSFGLTLITLVWVSTWIRLGDRVRAAMVGLFTAASVLEVSFISVQAWRGVPSHFNDDTSLDRAISTSLAIGGGLILISVLTFTVAALRAGSVDRTDMRLAIRSGLVLLVVALAVGVAMIARGIIALRSADPDLAYTTAGAFKPIHAVAMHGVLVLPGLAWLLGFTCWTDLLRLRVVQLGVVGYALVALAVGVESALEVSPFAAPVLADVVVITGLVALTLSGIVAVYGVVHFPTKDTNPIRTA